ncbi:MAG TPA: hypothetical protein VG123_27245 [Streptosporangiaceae bacterium]|nr:hypothetical protein [Streptosporangiaceae bacterium]
MQPVKPRLAETVRRPGARLIWASTLGLAVLALATFYVSFRAQFTFMYAVKHQDLPALIEALIADVAMVVCSLLALGMACAGQSAKVARLLVVLFAGLSAGMNYLAADVSSFRSVAVYVMPPVVFAVCTDQTVAVIRRHGLGIAEDSAWTVLGRLACAAARLAGTILLYWLRFILAPAETAKGLRRVVLNAAPLPETGQGHPAPEAVPEAARRPGTRLIWASTAGLAVLALATFYVSFRAQFTFMYAVKHQDAPALIEALIADVAMVVCSLLALGMACAGQPARAARLLVVVFAGLSAGMNYLAADVSSVRSVAVYVMPPVVFAVCTDQTVAVIRRHGLGITEDSAWTALGRLAFAAVRLAGTILLYGLRFILAPAETAKGLRLMVLNAAPLPGAGQDQPAPETVPETAPVPESAPGTVPEVIPRPALEAVPAIPERSPEHPQVTPEKQPGPATPERLAEFYAGDLASGRVPSKRQIKRDWPVG